MKKIPTLLLIAAITFAFVATLATTRLTYAAGDASTGTGSNAFGVAIAGPSPDALVVAQGDSDSVPQYAPVMACKELGSGRAVLVGDCNWFDDEYRNLGDNQLLLLNSFSWLSLSGNKILWIESTHYYSQYSIDDAYYDGLKALFIANGYAITKYTGTITDAALSGYDIVAITNTATGYQADARIFASGEIDAIENFVRNGHGLFLAAENGVLYGNDNFDPIASKFGVVFDNNFVEDPTDYYLNTYWPIIHTFAVHPVTSGVSSFYHIYGCSLSGLPSPVIPEAPFGTIMLTITMLIAFLGIVGFRRFRTNLQAR
jgi:hypothetical protein